MPQVVVRGALKSMQTKLETLRQQYYEVVVTECERQIPLITDLLNLIIKDREKILNLPAIDWAPFTGLTRDPDPVETP